MPALTMALLLPSAGSASADPPSACGTWTIVKSPDVGTSSVLSSVGADSSSTAWAVGNWYDGGSDTYHTLVERWAEASWTVLPSDDPGDSRNVLTGVSATTEGDVWGVGFSQDAGSGFRTLAEHPVGGSWQAVSSPSPGDQESVLLGVATATDNAAWAVGYQQDAGGPRRTLIERWNGTAWKVMSTPNVGTDDNLLYGVAVLTPSDVWAVGVHSVPWYQTLILHWNGTRWKVVDSPNVGDGNNFLYGITALANGGLVAVGSSLTDNGTATLALHRVGSSWSVVETPNFDTGFDELLGVAAVDEANIWAVGHRQGTFKPFRTLAEHWDGTRWTGVKPANRGTQANDLYGVTNLPGTQDFIAVGRSTRIGGSDRTLTESYCSA